MPTIQLKTGKTMCHQLKPHVPPVLFSVVRDFPLYNTCIRQNPFCKELDVLLSDNSKENKGIPVRYNEFLDSYDFSRQAWFIFCHEDFEICEYIVPILNTLSPDFLYGPIGCARKGFFPFRHQVFLGLIAEQKRGGSGEVWSVGRPVKPNTEVETFDCCCLIVHSTLIEKYHLRFDETLLFDLYIEDFCATARIKHEIHSRILPFKAIHHSGSRPTERLYRHLPYLRQKYPHDFFCASCTYFGTPSWLTRIERQLITLLRHVTTRK